MYQVLEEQATTDGLTGLVNHRTMMGARPALTAAQPRTARAADSSGPTSSGARTRTRTRTLNP
jgi:hypothetical protein